MAKAGHEVSLCYSGQPGLPIDGAVDSRAFESLDQLPFRPDIVHVHGLWSMDMAMAMSWCRRNGIKYFVSPHGCLMPRVFCRGWLKKHLFYLMFLRKNLNAASGIHCTGEGEAEAVVALGIKARTFVVPLGCDPQDAADEAKKEKMVLFLSRIGEEKGIVYLLDAWKRVRHDGWNLVIAGPDWEGYRKTVERKIENDGIADVSLFGPADAIQKDALYRAARLFVLPSPMENFSLVVLDALAYGLPVICTRGCPWRIIQERKCGWWVERDSAKALENALAEAIAMPPVDLQSMGRRAAEVSSGFSWNKMAERMLNDEHIGYNSL